MTVILGLLALGETPRGHVVLHHGTLFKLVSDGVCMFWAGHLEKLLKVISRLSCLALEITLSHSDVFLIGVIGLLIVVIDLLIVVIFIAASGNCDLLGEPLWPPPTTFGTLLSTFVGNL
jgi:hypothetical protein